MEAKFRKFKLRDLCRLVFLLDKEWELGDRESNFGRKIYSLIYAMEILKKSDILLSCEINNLLVGFVGYGGINFNFRNIFLKFLASFLEKILWFTPFLKNKKTTKLYNWSYEYLPDDLRGIFDIELSILILDKDYRNLGMGKEMFLKICTMASENGFKKMKISTDSASNWRFYLKNGCKILLEKEIYFNDGDSEKVLVLEKVF